MSCQKLSCLFANRKNCMQFPMFLIRVCLGVFFAISGFYKLFDPHTQEVILNTMIHLGIPFPHFNAVFVPLLEFLGGLALIFGFFTVLSSLLLFVILLVATFTEAIGTIPAGLNIIRWINYFLYLPEVLLGLLLFLQMCYGPACLAIDNLIEKKLCQK